jgi:hydrogenase maturation protease
VFRGKCLILGFGSDALSDDGLPVRLVDDLKTRYSQDDFTFTSSPVGGIELLGLLEGYEKAVLIDTQMTSRRKPGEIIEFTPGNFEETFHLSSQHDVSFQDAMRLAKLMEIEMPSQIHIVAIEVSENKILSFELSDLIRDKYPSILSYLCRVLNNISGRDDQ